MNLQFFLSAQPPGCVDYVENCTSSRYKENSLGRGSEYTLRPGRTRFVSL
jgi:hypothetical protein